MSLLNRKRTLLFKQESVYGTDPTPTGASNSILVRNLNYTPLDATTVTREAIRPFLGINDVLIARRSVKVEFEIELAGSGSAGSAAKWGPLLKSCGYSETLNTVAVTITRSSQVATVTETAHGRAVGDTVTISGCTDALYNGQMTIVTVPTVDTYTYAVSGSPTSPAAGSPLAGLNATYSPISDSIPSGTFYFNLDGVFHKVTGARGSAKFSMKVTEIPTIAFTFTGIYNAPVDSAAPSVDFTGWQAPKIVNTSNTSSFSLLTYSGLLESMELDLACQVEYRTLVGSESVNLIDRKPAGTFVLEAPTITAKDFFATASAGTTGAMTITHGTVGGNKVVLSAPRISLGNPSYSDSQGVAMLTIPFNAAPSATGNDELVILCK